MVVSRYRESKLVARATERRGRSSHDFTPPAHGFVLWGLLLEPIVAAETSAEPGRVVEG